MLKETPRTIYLKDYQPPEFLIDQVDLHFTLGDGETRVRSVLSVRRNPASESNTRALVLDGEMLKLEFVSIDGNDLAETAFNVDDTSLTIADVSDQFRLEIEVTLYPEQNTALEGLYKSSGMYCTQC